MTSRVPIRQLQQHASELVDRVAAGERIEITRNGRLIAVLSPPDPEQRVLEDLVKDGTIDPENAATARGLADWVPPAAPAGLASPSEALQTMRDEEER
ncbi:type II toxin-antitoxin system prevent-host-death family antitoxin [Kitasatospora sp. MAA4]|uniref:type II toxin-antitoxin system Phd/YefM family antitoxin n=1 Tax=Kitasatospora sp. MAA4 TaxID=3035093 RepID=UPI0024750251|nr:type II toxin-antitoxin system prevent-host-death family antitoxin [Kitasatospora sp. MAA4]